MKKILKENGRWNWFGLVKEEEEDSQDDNYYKGLFWDYETKEFLRWNELNKKECK
tara:strand:- start:40 stop:204 length:165 start_codon:yes stop_codon:yes gene_type:complete